jgi:hypothetical protein
MSLVLASEPTSLVAVNDQCAAVEAWAEQCQSIPELQDATNRLAAIDEYLSRTSTEGRGRVAAAMRRLEVRIGELFGAPMTPSEAGATKGTGRDQELVDSGTKAIFRRMAENPGVVEDVIAEATDEAPASRRKVTERIRDAVRNNPPEDTRTKLPMAERADQIRRLAKRNLTSPQIADEIGIGVERVRDLARRLDVEIPADAVFGGKFRKVDPNKVIDQIVQGCDIPDTVLSFVAYSELDRDRLEDWANSLGDAIRSLTTIKRNLLKELARDQ